ncbi:MAG: heavy-metal-associated domain-containing protein, partial [Verrucomicrobiae bacterium]|nr:heavy-metal-associated domain-containing protein [Verrucomicrobiae bacterium]
MRFLPFALICLFFVPASRVAADPAPSKPAESTLTFYVSGVECPACVFSVNDSVRRLDGVEEVIDGQNNANFINVTFDPRKVSAHQIAQAVTDAFPLHGAPYVATMRLLVPGYAEGGTAEKVAGVFAKWKDWVEFEAAKPGKGELVVRFRPLE